MKQSPLSTWANVSTHLLSVNHSHCVNCYILYIFEKNGIVCIH